MPDGLKVGCEWEETRRGQDAIATPKTVEAKPDVPTPTVIDGKTLSVEPEFPKTSIAQGDRPGWSANSSVSPDEPHGARLWIDGVETAKNFRSLVREPPPGGTVLAFPSGGQVARQTVPRDFQGAPPLREGEYAFEWFGYVPNEPNEMFLAGNAFKISNKLQVFPAPMPGVVARFDASNDADLEIVLEREQFHPFEYKAILLEAKITIRNLTSKPKYIAGGITWEIEPPEERVYAYEADIDVHRALHKLKEKRPELRGTIDPHDSISGWLHVALPHQPWGGVGGFTIRIEDEVGMQYVLRRKRRGGRKPL